MFDPKQMPRCCHLEATESPSAVSLTTMACSRFSYRALLKGNDDRYYAVAKILKGRNKGTYILFDREEQELYCQPKDASNDFCEMLGLDVRKVGFSF